jgi:hypothetical protein
MAKWEGDFYPDGNTSRPKLHYELESYMDSSHKQHLPSDYVSVVTYNIDWAIFKIAEEGKVVGHITLYGPWEHPDDIEGILEYDFGEDGSLAGLIA